MSRWLLPVMAGLVRPEVARDVISPAYDLYTPSQRLQYARARPRNFLNATLSEEDYPDIDVESRRVEALDYLRQELDEGTWRFGNERFTVLRLESQGHVQTGVVGDVPATAFPGLVRPHEHTRPRRVADLTHYLRAVGYGSSPVGLTYRRQPEIDAIVALVTEHPPDLDVTLEDGDRNTAWIVENPDAQDGLVAAFADVPAAYIIDGHHRVAATVQRDADPHSPASRFLSVAFPDDDLKVYPFHRWIDGELLRPGPPPAEPAPVGLDPDAGQAVVVTRAGEWTIDLGTSAGEEDVSTLARTVLGPDLGVTDERTDPRIAFVPGFPDAGGLRAMVAGRGGVGFILHPATVEAVMAVSDSGGAMPPKATFFAPKPRSGLFLVKR
ncbi:MAG TPA: DUF1015 family protein [Acidimicrobiia bacterium]|nr:DUF1015 family protein [Acidimicrobiia bacterium]